VSLCVIRRDNWAGSFNLQAPYGKHVVTENRVNVRLPDGLSDQLDRLVEDDDLFTSRAGAMRYALRQELQRQEDSN